MRKLIGPLRSPASMSKIAAKNSSDPNRAFASERHEASTIDALGTTSRTTLAMPLRRMQLPATRILRQSASKGSSDITGLPFVLGRGLAVTAHVDRIVRARTLLIFRSGSAPSSRHWSTSRQDGVLPRVVADAGVPRGSCLILEHHLEKTLRTKIMRKIEGQSEIAMPNRF